MRKMLMSLAALAVPAVLAAQAEIPANRDHASTTVTSKMIPADQASDTGKSKVEQAMERRSDRRATRVRGSVVGLTNRPPWIATPAATRAIPADGGGAARPAIPPTMHPPEPVAPAEPPRKPESPGRSGSRSP